MKKQKNTLKNSSIKHKTPFWFYTVLMFIPIIFFVFLEVILLVSNYGEEPEEWVSLSDNIEILNPEISKRYFSGINNPPFSTESFLLKQKPNNSFRVIVLGASSGAGYPYQNSASFSKYIRKCLQLTYPDNQIEVSNVSMAAINSYTILDLMPGIVEKKPDLILIYLGHNEYYGALGAGSAHSFASSRFITKLVLRLNEFRTVQLVKNIISQISGSINTESKSDDGTLMAQVASEKLIELESDIYNNGIDQYAGNLKEIFDICKDARVNVIIGTLASNVKDQSPFNPIKDSQFPSADLIYNSAQNELAAKNHNAADSLFTFAKDLDGLRFRAPEKINDIITKLAKEFGFKVADIKTALKSHSIENIIGSDLMTDHLHANVLGYQIIGKTFLEEMIKYNYLPQSKNNFTNFDSLDETVKSNYNFTKYDSTISDFRIKILKNDWPYKSSSEKQPRNKVLNSKTTEDKISLEVLDNKISRRDARIKLADYYFNSKDYKLYSEEIIQLTEEFPLANDFANEAAKKLITLKEYKLAKSVLLTGYFVEKDDFNTKWLGIINLFENDNKGAIKYLLQSVSFNTSDPQVLFNLAAAYSGIKEFDEALQVINRCIAIAPNYANAINIKAQLVKILNK